MATKIKETPCVLSANMIVMPASVPYAQPVQKYTNDI
jgi:hypothetical protein